MKNKSCHNCKYFADNLLGLNKQSICLLFHKPIGFNDNCFNFFPKSTFDDLK